MNPINVEDQIKEVEEDDDQVQGEPVTLLSQQNRIEVLKKEIDSLNNKISKINRGQGKWFDGDHKDFIRLYNKWKGDAKKIVQDGVNVLGMKNIEIMDHLQVY